MCIMHAMLMMAMGYICRYRGNDRSMLIPNTLFRMGGAAMVLTSRASERSRAKYELQHVVRIHLGADDVAYECALHATSASCPPYVALPTCCMLSPCAGTAAEDQS